MLRRPGQTVPGQGPFGALSGATGKGGDWLVFLCVLHRFPVARPAWRAARRVLNKLWHTLYGNSGMEWWQYVNEPVWTCTARTRNPATAAALSGAVPVNLNPGSKKTQAGSSGRGRDPGSETLPAPGASGPKRKGPSRGPRAPRTPGATSASPPQEESADSPETKKATPCHACCRDVPVPDTLCNDCGQPVHSACFMFCQLGCRRSVCRSCAQVHAEDG